MKDFEWRKRFAPNGYHVVRQRLTFEAVERAYCPRDVLDAVVDRLQKMLSRALAENARSYDPRARETRITVWPKEIGESVNHLDPLKPRFGIEIELRQPVL